jgi:predicted nucleic acid-binding Zn ribbon protein
VSEPIYMTKTKPFSTLPHCANCGCLLQGGQTRFCSKRCQDAYAAPRTPRAGTTTDQEVQE